MANHDRKPFTFDTEHRLVMLTGLKVRSLPELQRTLKRVPGSSVFFHTHQEYLAHNFPKARVLQRLCSLGVPGDA